VRPVEPATPGAAGDVDAPPDPAAQDGERLPRAQKLLARAREAFDRNNFTQGLKRADSALGLLDGASSPEASALRLEGLHLRLRIESRLEQLDDPLARLAEIEEAAPGRLAPDDYREIASDLAFSRRFDEAREVLQHGAGRFDDAVGNPLRAHAAFLARFAEAVEGRPDAPANVDENYLRSLRRNRPGDAAGLLQYALRAMSVEIWGLALLALHDAEWALARDGAPDPGFPALVRHNEILCWIPLGRPDEALEVFRRLVREFPERVDWIAHLQVGTRMAEAGANREAREVLERGRDSFPDHADRFAEALRGLGTD
jgi:tetratricopeptide (TPR) repeat protein